MHELPHHDNLRHAAHRRRSAVAWLAAVAVLLNALWLPFHVAFAHHHDAEHAVAHLAGDVAHATSHDVVRGGQTGAAVDDDDDHPHRSHSACDHQLPASHRDVGSPVVATDLMIAPARVDLAPLPQVVERAPEPTATGPPRAPIADSILPRAPPA